MSEKIARNLLGKKAIIEPWEKEEEGAKKKIIKKGHNGGTGHY